MKRSISSWMTILLVALLWMGDTSSTQAALTGYRSAVLADNPFLYYEFEETSGLTAANSATTGAVNNGTYAASVVLGGTETGAPLELGNAAKFATANTFVDVPNLGGNHTMLTVEAWVNADGIAGGCCTSIFSTDGFNNNASGKSLHFNIKSGRDLEHALAGGSPNNVNTVGGLIQNDTWYHIVATFDGTTGQTLFYVNGAAAGGATRGLGSINLSETGQIGAWNNTRNLPGHIDEFAFYDSVLTLAQVQAHYNAAFQAPIPEPATATMGLLSVAGLMLRRRRMA